MHAINVFKYFLGEPLQYISSLKVKMTTFSKITYELFFSPDSSIVYKLILKILADITLWTS